MPGGASGDARVTPDALIIGHLTRDLTPDGWRLGGAAYYAARTASLRGLRVAVVTSASAEVAEAARAALPGVALRVVPSLNSTTFENRYHAGARTQYLRSTARSLRASAIPRAWRAAPIGLLAPVIHEVTPALSETLLTTTLGLAPQGWLRAWGADERVRPAALGANAHATLARYSAVILSREDLVGRDAPPEAQAGAQATLRDWAARTPLLVVTRGADGAEVWRDRQPALVPGFPARELDPTGAGDVFAMTFLCALAAGADPIAAATEANMVAALSIEGVGASAIPTPETARARYGA